MEQARDDLDLAEDATPAPTTIRRACPVCFQLRVTDVCAPCGVDVATGELVQPPALPTAVAPPSTSTPRAPTAPFTWGRADVQRGLGQGLFGGVVVTWLAFSLQVLPGAFVGAARRESYGGGGGLDLSARVVTLYLLAFVLVARTRAVVRTARPYELDDVASSMLRALLVLGVSWPALSGVAGALSVAGLLPVVLGALSSERPLADLSPRSLGLAVSRSTGLFRATLASLLVLGPALVALEVDSPWALWRPPLLVLAATVAGVTAGLVRYSAEVRRLA